MFPFHFGPWTRVIVGIRCHHLGLIAGLSLMLGVAATALLPAPVPAEPANAAAGVAATSEAETSPAPAPAPALFLAGALLAAAALVRWRQKVAASLD
ncbi:MAG: hypothetical protein ABR553_02975 [Gammaproteobacteria bacterium]